MAQEKQAVHPVREFGKFSFRTEDLVGYGTDSHSKVFKGLFAGKEVAIKRVPKAHLMFQTNSKRGEHGDNDRHENIARYYMSEEDDHFYYIVMELCSCTLDHFIKGKYEGPSVGSDKTILHQIAKGLEYLHGKGLVNRNINPQTILISLPDGKFPPKMKLVDFTFSRVLAPGQNELQSSNIFSVYGLNEWTAPELIRKEESYNSAVDVFSLGCVFAYVLSKGKHPFGKFSVRFANMATGNLNLSETTPEIVDTVAIDLIEKMLRFKAHERISIQEVLSHPFFWDEEKCLTFILMACKTLEPQAVSKTNPTGGPLIHKLEQGKAEIFAGQWPDRLTPHAKVNLFKGVFPMKNKPEVTTSVFFLLKAMRNKWEHYHDVDDAAKKEYGKPPIEYYNYWTARFPKLLIYTWNVLRGNSDDPALSKFYRS